MKKIFYLLSFTTFFFVGCNAGANAQSEAISVGNPGSANSVIIERGYIATTGAQPVANPNSVVGNGASANQIQPAENPNPAAATAVFEDFTTTTSPSSETIQLDEAVMPYQAQ